MADPNRARPSAQSGNDDIPVQVREFTWLDPATWPAKYKYLPAYIALAGIFIAVAYDNLTAPEAPTDLSSYEACADTFNHSFFINPVLTHSRQEAIHSYEVGYAFEALNQIHTPERSVFGYEPFPQGKLPTLGLRLDRASKWGEKALISHKVAFFEQERGAVVEPASVGVAALMLSRKMLHEGLLISSTRQKEILLEQAPRYGNGAVSHRFGEAQLRAEGIGMFPPFLAYYGVATDDVEIIREAVRQIGLYRDVLQTGSGRTKGLWRHVKGSVDDDDDGFWSTGNAQAAYGMARVRATITAWPTSNATLTKEKNDLDTWIAEILSGAVLTDDNSSGLLRNYLGDATTDGEASGTALLTAAAYRMAILRPDVFGKPMYLEWMNRKRRAVYERVTEEGILQPVVNPQKSKSKAAFDGISPQGESFLLLLAAGWRDCVCNGLCLATYEEEIGVEHVAGQIKPGARPTRSASTGWEHGSFMANPYQWIQNHGEDFLANPFQYLAYPSRYFQGQVNELVKPIRKPFEPILNYFAPP